MIEDLGLDMPCLCPLMTEDLELEMACPYYSPLTVHNLELEMSCSTPV